MAKHGRMTCELGVALLAHFSGSGFEIYYDHGDKSKCTNNVAAIKAFFGEEVKNENRLADVDIAIVKDGNVVVLAEIEERSSSPKKFLGDVMAVLLSDRIAIKVGKSQKYFNMTPETMFYVVGEAPNKGSRLDKVMQIEQRLHSLLPIHNSINPKNIRLLFKTDVQSAIASFADNIKLHCR